MWWLAAAAAMQVVGGIAGGKAEAAAQARQAALDEFEARGVEEQARDQASRIYEQAQYVRAQQLAQYAGAGVVVGDGSAQAVADETERLSRRDAMAALYSGARQAAALRAGASQRMAAADDAVLTGAVKGIASGVSTYMAGGGFSGGSSATVVNNSGGGLSSAQWAAFRG